MRIRNWAIGVAVVVAAMLVAVPGLAQERDSDGTRMQARQVEIGTVHSGRLDPPDEEADWRMVQLEDQHLLELELTVETDGAEATLGLTEATGEAMETETTDSSAAVEKSVGAGIYYIAVESDDTLEYELTID